MKLVFLTLISVYDPMNCILSIEALHKDVQIYNLYFLHTTFLNRKFIQYT